MGFRAATFGVTLDGLPKGLYESKSAQGWAVWTHLFLEVPRARKEAPCSTQAPRIDDHKAHSQFSQNLPASSLYPPTAVFLPA